MIKIFNTLVKLYIITLLTLIVSGIGIILYEFIVNGTTVNFGIY